MPEADHNYVHTCKLMHIRFIFNLYLYFYANTEIILNCIKYLNKFLFLTRLIK